MGDTTLTATLAGVPVIPAEQPWFQAWVPFQSGFLSSGDTVSLQPSAAYQVGPYGLLDPTVPQPMGSFLHLGATDPDMLTAQPVADNDPQKQATFKRAYNLATQVSQFIDDYRVRGPTATPTQARLNETALLMNKGGWRDHTDGNRITTTAGDKVEVIGGNSVLVILGRPTSDNSFNAVDWSNTGDALNHEIESSGTFNYDNDGAPGHVEEIRWVDNPYPGTPSTWMVRSKTFQSHETSISSGASWESFVGTSAELTSGDTYSYHGRLSDLPSQLSGNAAFNFQPVMRDEQQDMMDFPYISDNVDETFVQSVTRNADASFGAGLAVNLTQNVTEYAVVDSIYSDTTVKGSTTELTTVSGSVSETTSVTGSVTETTTIGSSTATTAVAGDTSETTAVSGGTTAVSMVALETNEVSMVGLNAASVELIGLAKEEISIVGAALVNMEIAGTELNLSIKGASENVEIYGQKLDLELGLLYQTFSLVAITQDFNEEKDEQSLAHNIGAETEVTVSAPIVQVQAGLLLLGEPPVEEEEEAVEEVVEEDTVVVAEAAPEAAAV